MAALTAVPRWYLLRHLYRLSWNRRFLPYMIKHVCILDCMLCVYAGLHDPDIAARSLA